MNKSKINNQLSEIALLLWEFNVEAHNMNNTYPNITSRVEVMEKIGKDIGDGAVAQKFYNVKIEDDYMQFSRLMIFSDYEYVLSKFSAKSENGKWKYWYFTKEVENDKIVKCKEIKDYVDNSLVDQIVQITTLHNPHNKHIKTQYNIDNAFKVDDKNAKIVIRSKHDKGYNIDRKQVGEVYINIDGYNELISDTYNITEGVVNDKLHDKIKPILTSWLMSNNSKYKCITNGQFCNIIFDGLVLLDVCENDNRTNQ